MTQTALEKENAALREQLASAVARGDAAVARGDEALDLATKTSVQLDQATNLLTAATGAVVTLKAASPAPAPPIPPAPGATPMDGEYAAIKTGKDFMSMPASKQEAFEAKYPERARQLEAQYRNAIRLDGSSRSGSESHRIVRFGENIPPTVEESQAAARAALAGYQAGAPKPFFKGTQAPATVESLAAAMTASVHAGARPAPAPAPAPTGKSRHVGGGRK